MNRQEFSAKLVKIKNKAQVKLKDSLPYALQLNQNKVNALEKATFEYVMGNVFIYLKMCGTSMELIGKNVTYSTDNTDGLRKAIIASENLPGCLYVSWLSNHQVISQFWKLLKMGGAI